MFNIDGQPFFSVGGQVHNSSGYSADTMSVAWKALEAIHANTAEVPVYWNQIEPVQGRFDFSPVAAVLEGARQRGLRLILLWFGTWKNGQMKYAPQWVKGDPQRFTRVHSREGIVLPCLSSHCAANLEADKSAFSALMAYLSEADSAQSTVIAVQIENEPGILGSDRDYGPDGEAEFRASVPGVLNEWLQRQENGSAALARSWTQVNCTGSETWSDLFGPYSGEYLTAWSIARYIDEIAAAGKVIRDVPFYVNVWLDWRGWRIPGVDYPSGGATTRTLDIYRQFGPHLACIAPDNYVADARRHIEVYDTYSRSDNPLFVPESGHSPTTALQMFTAVADYGAVGFHLFGVESVLDADGEVKEESGMIVGSFRCLSAVAPLLARISDREGVRAVVQEEFSDEVLLSFTVYDALITFVDTPGNLHTSFRFGGMFSGDSVVNSERGRGLVIETGPDEFYIVGGGFRIFFNSKEHPSVMLSGPRTFSLSTRLIDYMTLEEGYFTKEGDWVAVSIRNGDESDHGIWVHPDAGVVRVLLAP